ncbi:hypothetical protein GN956_G4396 [Arapaima gigas]
MNGNTVVTVSLVVAAPYDKPQLSIYFGCNSVTINITTCGGFPQPAFHWRDGAGSDITSHSQTKVDFDSRGCIEVQNKICLPLKETETLTAVVNLEVLCQNFSRSLSVVPPSGRQRGNARTAVRNNTRGMEIKQS